MVPKTADGKTTAAGVIKIISIALSLIGVSLSPEQQETIISAGVVIYGTASSVQAYFTNKT